MKVNKQKIIENICYTELVYERINKKLSSYYSKEQIEVLISEILIGTNENSYAKKGKNFYVMNAENSIRITINSNTFRVITMDRIKK
jgi:hypothetical protein